MEAAISSVKEGCSVARVAVEHGVPRTTLNDKITSMVPSPILKSRRKRFS